MTHAIRRILPSTVATLALALASAAGHAQYMHQHGLSVAVGATGQFSTLLTTNDRSTPYSTANAAGTRLNTNVTNQQQYTTDSTGLLASLNFHPYSWAGMELNYGYTHYQERFAFNLAAAPGTTLTGGSAGQTRVPTDAHEATAAYQFHPKFIPFQPFLNIGGGAIDFAPSNAANQWRGAGLLEAGFDLPIHFSHIGFRVEGRSLYYRSPNFYQSAFSTHSWRVTEEPSISAFYRF